MLIDKALHKGATSCRRSRHLPTVGRGWSFEGPPQKGKQSRPSPGGGRGTPRLTYQRSCGECVLSRAMEADASEMARPWRSRQQAPGVCLSGPRASETAMGHARHRGASRDGVICCERIVTGALDSATTSQTHHLGWRAVGPRQSGGRACRYPGRQTSEVLLVRIHRGVPILVGAATAVAGLVPATSVAHASGLSPEPFAMTWLVGGGEDPRGGMRRGGGVAGPKLGALRHVCFV